MKYVIQFICLQHETNITSEFIQKCKNIGREEKRDSAVEEYRQEREMRMHSEVLLYNACLELENPFYSL